MIGQILDWSSHAGHCFGLGGGTNKKQGFFKLHTEFPRWNVEKRFSWKTSGIPTFVHHETRMLVCKVVSFWGSYMLLKVWPHEYKLRTISIRELKGNGDGMLQRRRPRLITSFLAQCYMPEWEESASLHVKFLSFLSWLHACYSYFYQGFRLLSGWWNVMKCHEKIFMKFIHLYPDMFKKMWKLQRNTCHFSR